MAWLTILSAVFAPLVSMVSALLKNTSVVLILLGVSLGFNGGDRYGRWRQARVDAVQVHNGGGVVPAPRVRPLRDLIHALVGDAPEEDK